MPDSLKIVCTKCGHPAKVDARLFGRQWRCLRCGVRFEITDRTIAPPPTPKFIFVSCVCGRHFRVKPEHAGKSAACPGCGQGLTIPALPAGAPAVEAAFPEPGEPVTDASEEVVSRRRTVMIAGGVAVVLLIGVLAFYLGRASQEPRPVAVVRPERAADKLRVPTPASVPSVPSEATPATSELLALQAATRPALAYGTSAPAPLPNVAPREKASEPAALTTHPTPPQAPTGALTSGGVRGGVSVGKEVLRLDGHTGVVYGVAYSPDGRYIASCSGIRDGSVRLWDARSGKEVRRVESNSHSLPTRMTFVQAGNSLLTSRNIGLSLWDVETGREIRRLTGQMGQISDVAASHGGTLVLVADRPSATRLWNVETGAEIRRFSSQASVVALGFSADDRAAVSTDRKGAVRVWDIQTGRELHGFTDPVRVYYAAAFSPDGSAVLVGGGAFGTANRQGTTGRDSSLLLWQIASGGAIRPFVGHTDVVRAVAFSPDGRFALSGGGGTRSMSEPFSGPEDNTVRLWHVGSGREVCRFGGHGGGVYSVAFSPDGRYAVSGSEDKTVRVWSVPPEMWAQHFDAVVPRENRDLPAIRRALNSEIPALIAEGKLKEAEVAIDEAHKDLGAFAQAAGVPLWDNSVAVLFRLADTKRAALLSRKPAGDGSSAGDDSESESDGGAVWAGKLTTEQGRVLGVVRGDLARVSVLIRNDKLTEAQAGIRGAEERLREFVEETRIPEWNRAVAAVFQLAATRQTELDAKREADKALAAEAARKKTAAKAPVANTPSARPSLVAGQFAPLFAAITVEGVPFRLQQYRGKWVLLDFWATWCGPCKAEMPHLQELYEEAGKDKRFVMISLSIDNQLADPLNYAVQNNLRWVQGFLGQGWNSPVLKAYYVSGIPSIFLIAPDGRIHATGLRGERMKAAVLQALGPK